MLVVVVVMYGKEGSLFTFLGTVNEFLVTAFLVQNDSLERSKRMAFSLISGAFNDLQQSSAHCAFPCMYVISFFLFQSRFFSALPYHRGEKIAHFGLAGTQGRHGDGRKNYGSGA